MIVGTMKAQDVDKIPVKLELTMDLANWRALAGQLQTVYPSWKIAGMIQEMIRTAEKTWKGTVDINDGGPAVPALASLPDQKKGK